MNNLRLDASDIVDGKIKLILGLLWTLILHYSITLPAWEIPNENGDSAKKLKPKQKLMNWLQAKLSTQMNIGNFTSDWNDGRAIGAVLDSCYPGQCSFVDLVSMTKNSFPGLFPNWSDRDPRNALENAKEAMELAEKWLGIPQVSLADRTDEMLIVHSSSFNHTKWSILKLMNSPWWLISPNTPTRNSNLAHPSNQRIMPIKSIATVQVSSKNSSPTTISLSVSSRTGSNGTYRRQTCYISCGDTRCWLRTGRCYCRESLWSNRRGLSQAKLFAQQRICLFSVQSNLVTISIRRMIAFSIQPITENTR